LKKIEKYYSNILIDPGEIETSQESLNQRILVISESNYLPNTLKVAQSIALRIPIVPYEWVQHLLNNSVDESRGGWCFEDFRLKNIENCSTLFDGISTQLCSSLESVGSQTK